MPFLLQPWHILLAALCGMVNERQQQVIEFQNAQIETLLKKLGKKRLLLNDDQRRLLAVKAHAIGRKALLELTTIVTPDTILRWHRKLVAKKFDSSNKRQPGRPRIRQEIVSAIVRFARENPTWGYDRIQGALKNVGYPHTQDTIIERLMNTYKDDAVNNWPKFVPPPAPTGLRTAATITMWEMDKPLEGSFHDLEIGRDGLVYAVNISKRRMIALDPTSGKQTAIDFPPNVHAPHSIETANDGSLWTTMAASGQAHRGRLGTWNAVSVP